MWGASSSSIYIYIYIYTPYPYIFTPIQRRQTHGTAKRVLIWVPTSPGEGAEDAIYHCGRQYQVKAEAFVNQRRKKAAQGLGHANTTLCILPRKLHHHALQEEKKEKNGGLRLRIFIEMLQPLKHCHPCSHSPHNIAHTCTNDVSRSVMSLLSSFAGICTHTQTGAPKINIIKQY